MLASLRVRIAVILLVAAVPLHASPSPQADLPEAKDNPVVSRFAGSTIIGYGYNAYDEVTLPLGPVTSTGEFDKTLAAKGKSTVIAYSAPVGKTASEIQANFRQSLVAAGFSVKYECAGTACGGFDFANASVRAVIDQLKGEHNDIRDLLLPTGGDVRYLVAELDRHGSKTDVTVMTARQSDQPAGILLRIVDAGAMQTGQVAVDAAAMSKGLAAEGKIALYGLHFATDSAKIEADSAPTLHEMAQLLQQQPALKVYIVGHTDNTGALAHNLSLSQQRAESVVKALTDAGIAPSRLAARGLASYAPAASNHGEDGKAKNRRVELVEQ